MELGIWPSAPIWPKGVICTNDKDDPAGRPHRICIESMFGAGVAATPAASPSWQAYAIDLAFDVSDYGGTGKVGTACGYITRYKGGAGDVKCTFRICQYGDTSKPVYEWQETTTTNDFLSSDITSVTGANMQTGTNHYRMYGQTVTGTPASTSIRYLKAGYEDA